MPEAKPRTYRPKGVELMQLQVTQSRERILDGRMVCIDPASGASSGVGYAEYVAGEFVRSGVIQPKRSGTLVQRLHEIQAQVQALGLGGADICIVERLRGRKVHNSLHWATGVLVTAVAKDKHIEVFIACWKAVAESDAAYAKGDEADARAMGTAIIRLARGEGLPDRVSQVRGRRRTKRGRAAGTGGVRTANRSAARVAPKKSRKRR